MIRRFNFAHCNAVEGRAWYDAIFEVNDGSIVYLPSSLPCFSGFATTNVSFYPLTQVAKGIDSETLMGQMFDSARLVIPPELSELGVARISDALNFRDIVQGAKPCQFRDKVSLSWRLLEIVFRMDYFTLRYGYKRNPILPDKAIENIYADIPYRMGVITSTRIERRTNGVLSYDGATDFWIAQIQGRPNICIGIHNPKKEPHVSENEHTYFLMIRQKKDGLAELTVRHFLPEMWDDSLERKPYPQKALERLLEDTWSDKCFDMDGSLIIG